MKEKINHAEQIIGDMTTLYPKSIVACSFGKDSMVLVDIARRIKPDIPIFAVMTIYKPIETFKYLEIMNKRMNLDVTVYIVGFTRMLKWMNGVKVIRLTDKQFRTLNNKELYKTNPDLCCELLKVNPTRVAVKGYDAWITGLRNTEGYTRVDYKEIEQWPNLIKINPILPFTEEDVWDYMEEYNIEPHPWYGEGYRSLGCKPCTVLGGDSERSGRWAGTSKCGGECGIHTQELK